MRFLILIFISFLISEKDTIDYSLIKNLIKPKKIDTSNISIDLNKGVGLDINFIPQNPSKGRISEKSLIDRDINEIKTKAKNYKVSDLNDNEYLLLERTG